MKFNELQALVLRKLDLQVKNLTPKIKKSYPKSYLSYPNQNQLYTMPSLRIIGRSVNIKTSLLEDNFQN